MDMKRILQAMDGVATKPVAGANDMAKFLRVVKEADLNQPAADTPVTPAQPQVDPAHYQVPSVDFLKKNYKHPADIINGAHPSETDPTRIGAWASGSDFDDLMMALNGSYYQARKADPNFKQPAFVKDDWELVQRMLGTPEGKEYAIANLIGLSDINDTSPEAEFNRAQHKEFEKQANAKLMQQPDGVVTPGWKYDQKLGMTPAQAALQQPSTVQENMDKFLSIVKQNDVSILNEGANPHKVSLPVQMAMQHYQKEETAHKPVGRDNVIRKYFKEVEEELTAEKTEKRQLINQYASIIAERVLMKESLDEACWEKYKQIGMKKKGRKMVPNCVPKESVVNEKSTTEKQARTMAAAAHNPEFAKKVGIKTSVAKEFNQKDKGTALLSNAMKGKKKVKENEIPGHSMGFTGGVGPGTLDNMIDEMPIEFNKENPNASTIHSHNGVNPASIEARIMRARGQLRELTAKAESNELIVWESISKHFPELAMNIEQIRHGIEELAKIRKSGGRRSHNIDKHIGESVMPTIKAATPTAPKTVKPKAKTSVCRAGQTQTGTQIKNGVSVPKCSVTSVKKKVTEVDATKQLGKDAASVGASGAAVSQLPFSLHDPVFPDFKYYTYWDLLSDIGLVSASYIAGTAAAGPTLGASEVAAVAAAAPAVTRIVKVLSITLKGLRLVLPDVPSMVRAIGKLAKSLYQMQPAEFGRFIKIASTEGVIAACANIGINFGIEKLDKAIDDLPDNPSNGISGKQAARNQRDAIRKFDTPNNPSPFLHPERYPAN
jgi:hypothetical protein